MTPKESAQVELVRVICILCMMWVHVSPGPSVASAVNGGAFDWIGDLLAGTLGRISTTTLSFIAGYLFWHTAARRPLATAVARRARTVLVPMLVWSAVFLIMAAAKEQFLGTASAAMRRLGGSWGDAFNAWAGVTAPMADESLMFLRDLFVATIILRLAMPVLARAPWLVVAATLVPALGLMPSAPVLFRPMVLLFMALGAASAVQGVTIGKLSQSRAVLAAAICMSVAAATLARADMVNGAVMPYAFDLFRRVGIGLLILSASTALLGIAPLRGIVALGRHSFLAFLSHVTVIGTAWVFWTIFEGGPEEPRYVIFYLVMPPMAFLLAAMMGRALDHAPATVQILLRGREERGGAA